MTNLKRTSKDHVEYKANYSMQNLYATSSSRILRMRDIPADFEADTSKSLKGKSLIIVKVTFRGLPFAVLAFKVFLFTRTTPPFKCLKTIKQDENNSKSYLS